jgi:TolB-like protein
LLETAAIIAVTGLAGTIVGVLGRVYWVKRGSQLTLEVRDRDELKGIRSELYAELKELRLEYKAQVVASIECRLRVAVLTEENARLSEDNVRLRAQLVDPKGGY